MRRRAWSLFLVIGFVITGLVTLPGVAAAGTYQGPNGARTVVGAIEQSWLALGGGRGLLGRPLTDELGTPNGRGRFNHFEGGSIYWSPATGPHEVRGAIRGKWAATGWENGVLGFPVTHELVTPDGRGRFNHFEGGSIYWSPTTAAYEVHGAIRSKWAELGWELSVLGYPLSDEQAIYNGGQVGEGRYNSFQAGRIYWSPITGAHEVHGAILDRWLRMGAVTSGLGFPVSDEYAVPGGRRSDFERGSLIWTPAGGVVLEVQFADVGSSWFNYDKGPDPMVADVSFTGATNNVGLDVAVASWPYTTVISRIGDWSGTVPIDFGLADRYLHTRWFSFSTMAGWTLRLRDLSTIPITAGGQAITSRGAQVLRLGGAAGMASFAGTGCDADARVRWFDASTAPTGSISSDGLDPDLTGDLAVGAGGYLEIRCDGPWRLVLP